MKASVLRVTGSVASLASCLVLFGGVASAQSNTIKNTGKDSTNVIANLDVNSSSCDNHTSLSFESKNDQDVSSGSIWANGNNNVNGLSTGDASASNSNNFTADVNNGCGAQTTSTPTPTPTPTPPSGGQGGGGQTFTTTTVSAPVSGGQGAGEVAQVAQVSAVPQGGVGAGTGGTTYLEGLIAVTMASGALAAVRLQKPFKALMGRLA